MSRGPGITLRERGRIIADLTKLPFPRVVSKYGRAPSTIGRIASDAMRRGELA